MMVKDPVSFWLMILKNEENGSPANTLRSFESFPSKVKQCLSLALTVFPLK